MVQFEEKDRYSMQDLLEIVALLRDPKDGCAWDKVQTHASIRRNFIEETYEVADAIDQGDAHLLCEELGDVLLQVALHTRMEEEQGTFTFEDVCTGICKKLIYRHPHIFGDVQAGDASQVLQNWEELKRAEKHREDLATDLDDVPAALPALVRAQKLQKRAAAHGVGLTRKDEAQKALRDACERLCRSDGESAEQQERALGEVLFAAAGCARLDGTDAEQALERANAAFACAAKKQAAHD